MAVEVIQTPLEQDDPKGGKIDHVSHGEFLAIPDFRPEITRLIVVTCIGDNLGEIYQAEIDGPLEGKKIIAIPREIVQAMREDVDATISLPAGALHDDLYMSQTAHLRQLQIINAGSQALRADA